jgi:hypothetical protein
MEEAKVKRGQERLDYLSYLIRLWRVQEGEKDVWRASVQYPRTGERVSFRTLDELFVFLCQQTGTVLTSQEDITQYAPQEPMAFCPSPKNGN